MTSGSYRASLLTPHGTGAIAVIRLEGPDPVSLFSNVWHPQSSRPLSAGRLVLGRILDGAETLDDALISVETDANGERAVEISCHGGIYVVQRILRLLEDRGARLVMESREKLGCWPTRNRIEAEAIEVLSQVKTERAALYAGFLRKTLPGELERQLLQAEHSESAREWVKTLAARFDSAQALLHGITVCLIGPPNSGKSTLLNTLLGRQAVVTSPVPGTTRDWVAETVEINGLAVELVDTAGRRETQCELEQQAIDVGNFPLERSDLVLLVLDQSAPLPAEALPWASQKPGKTWIVANKSDLPTGWNKHATADIERACEREPFLVSALLGGGCELLKESILRHFGLLDIAAPGLALFTQRQRMAVREGWVQQASAQEIYRLLMEWT